MLTKEEIELLKTPIRNSTAFAKMFCEKDTLASANEDAEKALEILEKLSNNQSRFSNQELSFEAYLRIVSNIGIELMKNETMIRGLTNNLELDNKLTVNKIADLSIQLADQMILKSNNSILQF